MDAKLAEYRARKRKEAVKEQIYNIMTFKSQREVSNITDTTDHVEV